MELRHLVQTLRRRWKFAVSLFLLGIGIAAAVTSTIPPTYSSTARVYVSATSQGNIEAFQFSIYSSQRVTSYAALAYEPAVLQRVIDKVGLKETPAELAKRITTEAVPSTVIVKVVAVDASPSVARRIAAAEAEEITALVERLETPKNTSDKGDDPVAPVNAKVAGEATYDAKPIAPNMPLNIAVGALLGLLVGVGGAALREMFDTSIKSPDDIAELTGSAVMTVVPFDSGVPKHPLISDHLGHSDRFEAFRVLRTNLQFVDLDSRHQTLVVSSAVPDEGKTVTATNLAIALAQTGRSVLLLDCDFRNPGVAKLLRLENSVGLLSVLIGRGRFEECVQRHESGVDFMGTGPRPPNPAEVLETQAMRDFLSFTREAYDVVVIDTPPLLPVADPAIVASMSDGVLLVTRYGRTSRVLVQQAIERLRTVDVRILGVVLNMTPRKAAAGYGYGYGYGEPAEIRPVREDVAGTRRGTRNKVLGRRA